MRRPAASPGRLLEASGNGRPREMVAATRRGWYRTRLIGLLPQRACAHRAAHQEPAVFSPAARCVISPTRLPAKPSQHGPGALYPRATPVRAQGGLPPRSRQGRGEPLPRTESRGYGDGGDEVPSMRKPSRGFQHHDSVEPGEGFVPVRARSLLLPLWAPLPERSARRAVFPQHADPGGHASDAQPAGKRRRGRCPVPERHHRDPVLATSFPQTSVVVPVSTPAPRSVPSRCAQGLLFESVKEGGNLGVSSG